MTLASVMVSLGLDQSNDARLELTGQLAEQFDAAVIGVAAAQFSPLYFTDGEMAERLIENIIQQPERIISEIRAFSDEFGSLFGVNRETSFIAPSAPRH